MMFMKFMCKKTFLVVFLMVSGSVFAATTTWTGATSDNWATSANWNGGVPNTTKGVYITDAVPSSGVCVIYSGTNATAADISLYANTGARGNVSLTIKSGASLTVTPTNFDLGYYGGAESSTLNVEAGATINVSGYFLNGSRPGPQYINVAGTITAGSLGLYGAAGGNGHQFIDFTATTGKMIITGDVTHAVTHYWAGSALLDRGAGSSDPGWGVTRCIIATYDAGTNKTTITPIPEPVIVEPDKDGYLPGDINGDGIVNLLDLSIFARQFLEDPSESIIRVPWLDARIYNSGNLNDSTITEAVNAIGSSVKTLLLAKGTWQITNSIIVPSNINLKFERGSILDISAAKTMAINGPIEADTSQIFSGAGTVSLGSLIKEAYPQWWGEVGTADDTAICQIALDSGAKTIRFLPGIYAIDGVDENINNDGDVILYGGLQPASDTILIFDAGSKLKAITNDANGYSVLKIENKDNVRIYGVTIEGERNTHAGTTGEFGMGILIKELSTRIVIKDANVYDCWGDGICIGGDYGVPGGIYVENSIFDNNRRNACSVVNAKNVLFKKCTFSNSNGTSPQKGVDIEPDHDTDYLQNIVFEDCQSYNNRATGFSFAKNGGLDNPISVTFRGCTSKGDGGGFSVDQGPSDTSGMVFITDCYSINARATGFSCGWANLPITINGLSIVNPNQDNLGESWARYASGFVVVMGDDNRLAGNITARNVHVESTDGKAVKALCLHHFSAEPNSGIENIDIELTTSMPNHKRMFKSDGVFLGYCRVRFPDDPEYAATGSLNAADAAKYIGQTITNQGAAGDIVVSLTDLGVVTNGSEFTFVVKAGYRLTLDMTGHPLFPGNKTSYYSSTIGDKLKIRSDGTNWYIEEQIGTWQ